jgi:hypothetical protein
MIYLFIIQMQYDPNTFNFYPQDDCVYVIFDPQTLDIITTCHSFTLAQSFLADGKIIKGPIRIMDHVNKNDSVVDIFKPRYDPVVPTVIYDPLIPGIQSIMTLPPSTPSTARTIRQRKFKCDYNYDYDNKNM